MISQDKIDEVKKCYLFKDCYSGPGEYVEDDSQIRCIPETCKCFKIKEDK